MQESIYEKLPQNFLKYEIERIESGASSKIIFRLNKNKKSYILIDFKKDKKEYKKHVKIFSMLKDINISIPKIIDKNDKNQILICEDFGDFRYDKILNKYSAKDLLKYAVDTLLVINHSIKYNKNYQLDQYSFKTFNSEIIELPKYYFPYIKLNNYNLKKDFMSIWLEAFENFNFEFDSFIHKDFNINNLFFIPSKKKHLKCGVIDFQSAFWGESSWDLFSLLEDSRMLFTDKFNEELIAYFFRNSKINSSLSDFKMKYHFLNCSRQTRLLGRWVKLTKELDQDSYLKYIPVTLRRLKKSLDILNDKNLSLFYKTYILK